MNQQGTSHHQYRKFQNGIPLLADCLKKLLFSCQMLSRQPAAFSPPGLPRATAAASSPALQGPLSGARGSSFNTHNLGAKPEHLSKVNFAAGVTFTSPGPPMCRSPQRLHRNRTVFSRRHPGQLLYSPVPSSHLPHSNHNPQSSSPNHQPQLRENQLQPNLHSFAPQTNPQQHAAAPWTPRFIWVPRHSPHQQHQDTRDAEDEPQPSHGGTLHQRVPSASHPS